MSKQVKNGVPASLSGCYFDIQVLIPVWTNAEVETVPSPSGRAEMSLDIRIARWAQQININLRHIVLVFRHRLQLYPFRIIDKRFPMRIV